jgi:FkbM family methyltransferase
LIKESKLEMNLRVYLARIKKKILSKPFYKDPHFPSYWFLKALGGREASIVQIGSNDGKTGDPLNKLFRMNPMWNGLFVEPIPYLFERLKSNYPNQNRFCFENVAINEGKKLVFYWVDPEASKKLETLPYWYDQLGSFDKNHIINELGEKIIPFILTMDLEGIRLNTLFKRNNIDKIDLLHIDTEGYDWKILSQLDLDRFKPKFIMFEANHLNDLELSEVESFLKGQFSLFKSGIDILAVRIDENENLDIGEYFSPFSIDHT